MLAKSVSAPAPSISMFTKSGQVSVVFSGRVLTAIPIRMFRLAPYGALGLTGMGVLAADATYCINAPENSSVIVTVGLFGSRQKTLLEAATLSDIGLLIVA